MLETDGTWSRVNHAFADFLGYPVEELTSRTFRDVTHPDDLDRDVAALADLNAGPIDEYQVEKRYIRGDGTVAWGLLTTTVVATGDQEPLRAISQVLDITDRVRAERFRAAQNAVAHATVESSDVDDGARTMLREVSEVMGWREGAVWVPREGAGGLRQIASWRMGEHGEGAADRESPQVLAGPDSPQAMVLASGAPAILPADEDAGAVAGSDERLLAAIRGDGETIGVLEFRGQVVGRPDAELEDLLSGLGGQVWQLFTRKRAARELAHQAMHDALTGLPNRALMLDRLEQALARAKRASSTVAVLFIDVDNFKFINDTRGHDVGDEFLKLFAQRVRRVLRPADSMARLGGDEFALLLEDLRGDRDAQRVADRILLALERPFDLGEDEQVTTASIGIAVSSGHHDEAGALLRDADAAMHLVKARGRAGYEFYTERMRDEALARIETERALRVGLDRDELRLAYQPQISLESGRVVAVEALVRWDHPEHGLVRPRDFISVAEEPGAIVTIGAWALREACRQAAAWRAELGDRAPLPLFLNLSARQLVRPDLMATVARAVTEAGVEFGDIGVEITEGALIVVAEGIETAEQEALAREYGCTMVQGFRFSPPVSPDALAELLDRFG